MQYLITISEVIGTRKSAAETTTGVIAVRAIIYPPLDLNPAAVEQFMGDSTSKYNPILLGNCVKGTVIYQALDPSHCPSGTEAPQLAEATQALLGRMSVESRVAN